MINPSSRRCGRVPSVIIPVIICGRFHRVNRQKPTEMLLPYERSGGTKDIDEHPSWSGTAIGLDQVWRRGNCKLRPRDRWLTVQSLASAATAQTNIQAERTIILDELLGYEVCPDYQP